MRTRSRCCRAQRDLLVVDESAALAADVYEVIGVVFVNDLGMLARDGIGEQLQVIFRLAPDSEDRLAERQRPHDAETVDDF